MRTSLQVLAAAAVLAGLTVITGSQLNRATGTTAPQPTPKVAAVQAASRRASAASQSSAVRLANRTALQKINRSAASLVAPPEVSPYPDRLSDSGDIVANGVHYPLRQYHAAMTVNDPSASQWWVSQTGLPAAWDYGSGSGTKIAVIDTGFALQHEELSGRWLDNPGESGTTTKEAPSRLNCTDQGKPLNQSCNLIDDNGDGIVDNESGPTTIENPSWLNCTARGLPLDKSCNGIDDDGNGFIDDYRGWDFNSGDASVQAGEINPKGQAVFHGTAVSGMAAATGNNNLGIAGVSWGTKILPLQALDDDGSGNTLTIARAIRYAADRGVDVISMSLGSTAEDPYLRQAIDYAIGKGAVVVAAAGNESASQLDYPARYPEVVGVGAENPDGSIASFSNSGDTLDIIAPGSGLTLPIWSQSSGTNAYGSNLAGTSFATPFVSGLLANARAKQPNASWGELVGLLLQTADHRTLTASSPRSNALGFGVVRADAYMARLSNPYSQQVRYYFGSDTSNSLGSASASSCTNGQYGTAPFYEVHNSSTPSFTTSDLTAWQQQSQGASVTQRGYICVGLPTDSISTPRLIDPIREFLNLSSKG